MAGSGDDQHAHSHAFDRQVLYRDVCAIGATPIPVPNLQQRRAALRPQHRRRVLAAAHTPQHCILSNTGAEWAVIAIRQHNRRINQVAWLPMRRKRYRLHTGDEDTVVTTDRGPQRPRIICDAIAGCTEAQQVESAGALDVGGRVGTAAARI